MSSNNIPKNPYGTIDTRKLIPLVTTKLNLFAYRRERKYAVEDWVMVCKGTTAMRTFFDFLSREYTHFII